MELKKELWSVNRVSPLLPPCRKASGAYENGSKYPPIET